MRTAFIDALTELAGADERVWLVAGDLGYSVVERFRDRYPDRFLNSGVAEQNMIGLSAGLAMTGKTPWVYSIANFPTLRCLEQIRLDVCYHDLPVRVVAIGGGLAYGTLGASHFATEDLAVMTAMPRMTVVAPGDPVEARQATVALSAVTGPCYLRLGKAGEPIVHQSDPDFEVGRAIVVRAGDDLAILSTGGILANVVAAADDLGRRGVSARVLSVHTLKPLDRPAILEAAKTGAIMVVEEHSGHGGLGAVVAQTLVEAGIAVRFRHLHLPDDFFKVAGGQEYLRGQAGLGSGDITERALAMLGGKP